MQPSHRFSLFLLTLLLSVGALTDASAQAGSLVNLSTRGFVGTGENDLRAGFIVDGDSGTTERFIIKAEGPILNMPGTLQNPELVLKKMVVNSAGTALEEREIAYNDNWRNDPGSNEVENFAAPFSDRKPHWPLAWNRAPTLPPCAV